MATAAPEPTQEDWRSGIRGSRRNQLLVLLVTALLVAGGAWLLGGRTGSGRSATAGGQSVTVTGDRSGPAPEVGKAPQDFTATTVTGERVSLASLKGKPVWLTFGASWCTACRAEAPDLEAAYQAAKGQGLQVVAVNLQEKPADVLAYAGRVGLTYPQVADPETALASRFRIAGLPTHFFVDKDGVLRKIHVGGLTRAGMGEQIAAITR
ncbi:TlpA family protein disulfide reductase [Arsenicicoccus dermatophilus]|uniref:TlpA family protein disulfide reductase n=1 Tax=Arsenicicoccus dermatophilus TaxID=1076331 RepID=UPI001F4CD2C7|nr:TlpA disulfide reductase family protein [Arsenicicoccus dermatophilus]MCH8614165.1 TlpA family protein disulfide reductase [Arsenicicoccus dermatophilus]